MDQAPGPSNQGPASPDQGPLSGTLRPRGPVRFGLEVDEGPDRICVRIRGEVDILTTPKLAAELNGVVRRSTHHVVLDLRKVGFIDSAGLQILLGTQRRLSHSSRRLTVVCDDGPVRRLIELTRLEEILGLVTGAETEDW